MPAARNNYRARTTRKTRSATGAGQSYFKILCFGVFVAEKSFGMIHDVYLNWKGLRAEARANCFIRVPRPKGRGKRILGKFFFYIYLVLNGTGGSAGGTK